MNSFNTFFRALTAIGLCMMVGVVALGAADGKKKVGIPPTDLEGREVSPLTTAGAEVVVLFFASNDCPIANRYAPEMKRLHEQFSKRGVSFFLVHANADEDAASVKVHHREFGYPFPAIRDPGHQLVKKAKATVTPEAAVFLKGGKLVYHGRIDDKYPSLGQERVAPTKRELAEVLEAVLLGKKPAQFHVAGVGCSIPDAP